MPQGSGCWTDQGAERGGVGDQFSAVIHIVVEGSEGGEDGSLLTGAGEDQSAVLKEHVASKSL